MITSSIENLNVDGLFVQRIFPIATKIPNTVLCCAALIESESPVIEDEDYIFVTDEPLLVGCPNHVELYSDTVNGEYVGQLFSYFATEDVALTDTKRLRESLFLDPCLNIGDKVIFKAGDCPYPPSIQQLECYLKHYSRGE